jgi:hypothetical protein
MRLSGARVTRTPAGARLAILMVERPDGDRVKFAVDGPAGSSTEWVQRGDVLAVGSERWRLAEAGVDAGGTEFARLDAV